MKPGNYNHGKVIITSWMILDHQLGVTAVSTGNMWDLKPNPKGSSSIAKSAVECLTCDFVLNTMYSLIFEC